MLCGNKLQILLYYQIVTVTEDLWKSSGPTFNFGLWPKTHYLCPKIGPKVSKNGQNCHYIGVVGNIYPNNIIGG